MSAPISGLGSPPPGFSSSDPPIHSTTPPPTTFFDSVDPAFQLELNVDPSSIHLQPGVSLIELTALISTAIQDLKKTLSAADYDDNEIERKFYLNISETAGTALDALNQVLQKTLAWNDSASGAKVTVRDALSSLKFSYDQYRKASDALASSDSQAIDEMNSAYQTYENLTPSDIDTPAKEQVARDSLNAAVTKFNDYVASSASARASLQQELTDLNNETTTYNDGINSANATIILMNEARVERTPSLSPYPLLKPAPAPVTSSPLYPTMNDQPMFPDPLDPGNSADLLQFYTQAVSTKGTEGLRSSLKGLIQGVTDQDTLDASIDLAISNAQSGSYATEGDFFSNVRSQLVSILGTQGSDIFDNAIFNVPVLESPETLQENGDINDPPDPGQVPTLTVSDFMNAQWLPVVLPLLDLITALNTMLDFSRALADLEGIYFKNPQKLISYPVAFIEKISSIFLKDVGGVGTGVGLGSFAIGLQTRNLEEILSRGIIQAVASQTSFPVSGRVFARLLCSTLDLLSKSSLLGTLPASFMLANRLGSIGASSPVIELAISLGFSERIANVINANVVRSLVNGQINQIAFGTRFSEQIAQNGVNRAEILLQEAINSGDSAATGNAVDDLVKAELQLAGVNHLLATFGSASVGELSQLTSAASASINLSLLTVALAEFGKSIGLPELIPQLFANFSGLPTAEILAAMNKGAGIGGVLENPLSVLFLKQTLLDTLVNRGFSSVETAEMVNNAINNIVLSGGINTFSHLKSTLFESFRQEGLGQLDANS
ncbi:MAG TPA: hypothetical protein VIH61_07305, partial [Waddliaceae bacterium]